MTNPKNEPTPKTEKIDPTKKGGKGETQHESGSHDTNPDTADGKTKSVENLN